MYCSVVEWYTTGNKWMCAQSIYTLCWRAFRK